MGACSYGLADGESHIYVASADFETGKVLSPPTIIPKPDAGLVGFPSWSPDEVSRLYGMRDAKGYRHE